MSSELLFLRHSPTLRAGNTATPIKIFDSDVAAGNANKMAHSTPAPKILEGEHNPLNFILFSGNSLCHRHKNDSDRT